MYIDNFIGLLLISNSSFCFVEFRIAVIKLLQCDNLYQIIHVLSQAIINSKFPGRTIGVAQEKGECR